MELADALRSFGHADFRPGQQAVVQAILNPGHTLAVMPTGFGKSLCYQLPAVMLPGTTVVVSPLVALIRDQVQALQDKGIRAASITGQDRSDRKRQVLQQLSGGELDLVDVAPERFRSPSFRQALESEPVDLFAVDEAHCISQWGHDFRPDYARLGEVLQALRPPRVAALTATATPAVRRDIIAQLGLEAPRVVVTGFDRPNLVLEVYTAHRRAEKLEKTASALSERTQAGGAGIVYVATRKKAEQLADALSERGFDAHPYHAGMGSTERQRVEQHFQSAPRPVVAATTAFGMGIDRADVRVVVHYQIPGSVEAYYQEVGRAGRDGEPAHGLLIYDQADLRHAFAKHEASCPSPRMVAEVLDRMADHPEVELDFMGWLQALEPELGPSTRAALVALEQAGDIRLDGFCMVANRGEPSLDPALLEERARRERARLDAMIGYVTRSACRRRYLVDYFEDPSPISACGVCDRCVGPAPRELQAEELQAALMALSCIARMKGRYGKTRVVDVLLGSRAQPVRDAGLEQLSTHGLWRGWDRNRAFAMVDALVAAGLAQIAGSDYPKLMLTEAGVQTLKARGPVQLRLDASPPTPSKRSAAPTETLSEAERQTFEALRAWRAEVARRIEKPPYVIAHDRTLVAVAMARPSTPEELLAVPGFGPAKVERYGAELLRALEGAVP